MFKQPAMPQPRKHSAKAVLPSLSCAFVKFGPSVCHGDYSWSVENANVVASCSKERVLSKGFCVGFDGDSVPVVNDSVLSRNSLDLKKTVAEYWYFLKPCPEKTLRMSTVQLTAR